MNFQNRILIIKRSTEDRYRPGEWEFPGGKVERGEEIGPALRAEIKEEVGLDLDPNTNFMHTESRLIESGPYEGSLYLGLCGVVAGETDSVTLSQEHDNFAFRAPREIQDKSEKVTPETIGALQALLKQDQLPST